ncbi:hypothetical protein OUZ56_028208 [Daphnia magna]|uniref:Uncharacterized protein n=1 Tax=Daphnia magna TaxID=35525 RepID=A0ABR0B363_9CRUS|nr:hypothetical protein OUZ56_028208 [Daphnia magna]
MRKRIRLIGSGRSSDLLDTRKKSLSIPALLLHRYVVHGFTLYVDTPGVLLSFATQFEIEH